MRHIREVKVDGGTYDVESDDKGVTFRKRGSELPFLSIVWQDVYSAAWKFAEIRTEYDRKTSEQVKAKARKKGGAQPQRGRR
jgi:hypothetical protein